eukprot:CAMPEP_0113544356 /NCGR_PEP_ID=MMETSP0015_2-20120614/10663_1 /TAXON_ID=2838 /ORGANISM="Odontella" /LENGTH=350 /DNA_ID=CAMNT_0000444607 /DNA_START=93 /DNA_END=1141 /DNA_ORIENTATION=+ /assembly_acc=CAM_ASM_000160
MGGSCSLQRQRAIWNEQQEEQRRHRHRQRRRNGRRNSSSSSSSSMMSSSASMSNSSSRPGSPGSSSGGGDGRRSLRHSVEGELPDGSISALYPVDDNYILEPRNNGRSPKSLKHLCVDAVCRTLPYLDGHLPPGLPQDVVDSVVRSLVDHSALNAATLRALKCCELSELSLAGCRGVRDEWLRPLSGGSSSSSSSSRRRRGCGKGGFRDRDEQGLDSGDYYNDDDDDDEDHCSAHTPVPRTPPSTAAIPSECYVDAMDLDGCASSGLPGDAAMRKGNGNEDVHKDVVANRRDEEEASSCCSDATFHSASSTHFAAPGGTPLPTEEHNKDKKGNGGDEDIKMGGSQSFDTA